LLDKAHRDEAQPDYKKWNDREAEIHRRFDEVANKMEKVLDTPDACCPKPYI
jgi:hypothetical protein